jgi:Tol biopolymer transport system component
MQRTPQAYTPFWIIGITMVFIVAFLFLREGASPPFHPTPTHTPVEIDFESLPTVVMTAVSKTATLTLTPTASPSHTPNSSSKGSGRILFVSDRDGNQEIYVMDFDGQNKTRLTQNPGRDISPRWSPDGTKIAFLSERENKRGLYVMDIGGRKQTLLASSVVFDEGELSWAPDSTRLAYSSLRGPASDIFVITLDGSMEQNLTATSTREERGPSWSPDGTKIAFYENDRLKYFMMNSDGSDQTKVINELNLHRSQLQWSPDGLSLLISASNEIFSVHKDIDSATQLTNNQNYDGSPSASPNGTKIAFVSTRAQGSHEIFIMDADGANVEKISNVHDTRASISNLLWAAAGNEIFFTINNYRGGLTTEIFSININTKETTSLTPDPFFSNYLSDVAP